MKRASAILLLVIMVLPPRVLAGQVAARAADAVGPSQTEQVDLLVGRSTIIRMDRPITRVSLSTPDIADALVTTPYELLVHGKTPGTISLLVWGDNGRIKTYDVAVKRDLSNLETQIRKLFPGEEITATSNGKDVVLAGVVSSKYIVDRASSLAVGYVEKPENVVNLLRQQDGPATNQVLLRVRFAEVSRSAMQELGASFFTGINGKGDWIGRSTTQQYPAPIFDDEKGLVFSDFLNLFLFNTDEQLGTVIRALKGKGLFQSLAEPNLITRDGQEATFLAGGEYPYPVVQGSGINAAVTVVFKEFGVRLRFTPTVTADGMIQLKVMPEVSTLDFGNAVVLSGFRVPALSTRRTETAVELRDGQTFAIAGMIDNNMNETLRRVPGIGDIPVLGYLFRSQAYQKNATELVVMITPHIVRRDSPGVTPNLPGLVQPYLPPLRRLPSPPPAFTSPMTFAPESMSPAANAAAPTYAPQAQSATAGKPSPASQTATTNAPAAFAAPASPVPVAPLASAPQTKAEREAAAQAQRNAKKAAEVAAQIERKRAEQAAVQARKDAEQAKRDQQKQAELKRKQDEIAAREAHLQAQRDGERARQAAKEEAERAEREKREQERIKKAEAERLEIERKAADKEAAEQAAEAARIKEEADKLAQEKANRDAELQRLMEQYQKLTGSARLKSSPTSNDAPAR
jgi:pilus assembly protein CpaC